MFIQVICFFSLTIFFHPAPFDNTYGLSHPDFPATNRYQVHYSLPYELLLQSLYGEYQREFCDPDYHLLLLTDLTRQKQ